MCGQQIGHALAQEALGVAAPAVAQRHDQNVHLGRHAGKAHRQLAPVDLRLLARSGLEAPLRQRRDAGGGAQWAHGQLNCLVAAAPGALAAQLMLQDARRVVNLRGARGEPLAVAVQQGQHGGLAPVRRPNLLLQAAAHGLAVQVQFTGDRRDGLTGGALFVDRLPLLLPNQALSC